MGGLCGYWEGMGDTIETAVVLLLSEALVSAFPGCKSSKRALISANMLDKYLSHRLMSHISASHAHLICTDAS